MPFKHDSKRFSHRHGHFQKKPLSHHTKSIQRINYHWPSGQHAQSCSFFYPLRPNCELIRLESNLSSRENALEIVEKAFVRTIAIAHTGNLCCSLVFIDCYSELFTVRTSPLPPSRSRLDD